MERLWPPRQCGALWGAVAVPPSTMSMESTGSRGPSGAVSILLNKGWPGDNALSAVNPLVALEGIKFYPTTWIRKVASSWSERLTNYGGLNFTYTMCKICYIVGLLWKPTLSRWVDDSPGSSWGSWGRRQCRCSCQACPSCTRRTSETAPPWMNHNVEVSQACCPFIYHFFPSSHAEQDDHTN